MATAAEEERRELPVGRPAHRGAEGAEHEDDPEEQTDREQQLPEASEVEILRALVAEPEPEIAEPIVDAEALADEATADDDGKRAEQRERAETLHRWFLTADEWCEEETTRDPRGGDPENGELEMPGAKQVVRQPAREIETVEAPGRRDNALARHRRASAAEEHDHDREVEPHRLLARRRLPTDQPAVLCMAGSFVPFPPEIVELAECKQDRAEATEQCDQAERAPEVGRRGRDVADQRLVRPVVGVRVVLAGTVGDGRPGCPRKISGERVELGAVPYVTRWQTGGGGFTAEIVAPLLLLGRERRHFDAEKRSVSVAGS